MSTLSVTPLSKNQRRRLKKKETLQAIKDKCHNDLARLKFFSKQVELVYSRFKKAESKYKSIRDELHSSVGEKKEKLELEKKKLSEKMRLRYLDYERAHMQASRARNEFKNFNKI